MKYHLTIIELFTFIALIGLLLMIELPELETTNHFQSASLENNYAFEWKCLNA